MRDCLILRLNDFWKRYNNVQNNILMKVLFIHFKISIEIQ